MSSTRWRRLAAIALLLAPLVAGVAAQRGRAPDPPLPPLSMTCPHHPDVIETAPGTCPQCRMALVPVRLAPAWTCPLHPVTIEDAQGTCPLCRRQLVPVTVSVTYRCGSSADETLEPGTCPDGRPRARTRTLRPHGDHNPRHGGQFFMAGDNWHHVEGVHPAPRMFRLHVYDDYGRPLPADRLRQVQGRVVASERFDPASRRYIELVAFPLRAARDGTWLEARVDRVSLPLELTAKVRFSRTGEEYRFDFTFHQLTQVPAAAAVAARPPPPRPAPAAAPSRPSASPASAPTTAAAAAATPPPAASRPAPAPAPEPAVEPSPADPALTPVPIPETVEGMVEQLRARSGHVAALIARGDFQALWVPAFAAKDVAVALEPHLSTLDPARREAAAAALQNVVRLAWLLDASGDAGNREQIQAAYAEFFMAVTTAATAFAGN
jgi:hypothetical protein